MNITELEPKSVEEWRTALEAAVAERGERFKYRDLYGRGSCQYSVDGAPACIIGTAFYNLYGQLVPENNEGSSAEYVVPGAFEEIHQRYLADVEDTIVRPTKLGEVLAAVQFTQDSGGTWGEALEVFEEKVEEVKL